MSPRTGLLFLISSLITVAFGPFGHALPPDRAVLSHCGALLFGASIQGTDNQDGARKIVRQFVARASYLEEEAGRRLPYHGGARPEATSGVRLGVDGDNMSWPNARTTRELERSIVRLRQLHLDLERGAEVLSVTSEVRGEAAIATYLRKHEMIVRNLDHAVYDERRSRRMRREPDERTPGVMGLGFIIGGVVVYGADVMESSSDLAAGLLGAIGIGYLIKPTEDLIARQRDARPARSPRRDDVDRFVATTREQIDSTKLPEYFAHVGFTVGVDDALATKLQAIHHIDHLPADALLDAERNVEWRPLIGPDRRAQLHVDQVLTRDEDSGEPILLNVARMYRRTGPRAPRPPEPRVDVKAPAGLVGAY